MTRKLYKMLSYKGTGKRRSEPIEDIFLFQSMEMRRAESVREKT